MYRYRKYCSPCTSRFGSLHFSLSHNKPNSTVTGQNLNPFLDDVRTLRVNSHLLHAAMTSSIIYTIILPKRNYLTRLIDHYHVSYLHTVTQTVNVLIPQNFWINIAPNVIWHLLSNCLLSAFDATHRWLPYIGNSPATCVRTPILFKKSAYTTANLSRLQCHARCALTPQKQSFAFPCVLPPKLHI